MSEYYRKGKIEVWDFIKDKELDYFEGNVVKYICRWREKNGIEDLEKARDYLDKLIIDTKEEFTQVSKARTESYFNNLDTD